MRLPDIDYTSFMEKMQSHLKWVLNNAQPTTIVLPKFEPPKYQLVDYLLANIIRYLDECYGFVVPPPTIGYFLKLLDLESINLNNQIKDLPSILYHSVEAKYFATLLRQIKKRKVGAAALPQLYLEYARLIKSYLQPN